MEHHPAAPTASVPVSIRDWIASAGDLPSANSFVESAVDLAWRITKRTCDAIEESPFPGLTTSLEDQVTAENVIVFLSSSKPSPSTARGDGREERPAAIADVKFRFEIPGAVSLPPEGGRGPLHGPSSSGPGRRAISAALGKLFLELFSGGNSSKCSIGYSDVESKHGSSSNCATQSNKPSPEDVVPPMGKRCATDRIGGSARNLLISLGMPLSIRRLVCDLRIFPSYGGS